MDPTELRHRFDYHQPGTAHLRDAHSLVRTWAGRLALRLNILLPEGQEKALAITKLEEVMFWANASIARDQEDVGELYAANRAASEGLRTDDDGN